MNVNPPPQQLPLACLIALMSAIAPACLNDLDFDDIEPSCTSPRFDVPSRDMYCSAQVTTSIPAPQEQNSRHYVAIASLGERAFVLEGTLVDSNRFDDALLTGTTPDAQLLSTLLNSDTPVYDRIQGWSVDLNNIDAANLSDSAAVEFVDVVKDSNGNNNAFPVLPLSRMEPLSTQGDAVMVSQVFGDVLLLQFSSDRASLNLEISTRLALVDEESREVNDPSISDIAVAQLEPDRVLVLMAAGGEGIKSIPFRWDGNNWVEDTVDFSDTPPEDFDATLLEPFTRACCERACATGQLGSNLLNRCIAGDLSGQACFGIEDPWTDRENCIQAIFSHRPITLVSTLVVSPNQAETYSGGLIFNITGPGPQDFTLQGVVTRAKTQGFDPRNYISQGLEPPFSTTVLPPVTGMAEGAFLNPVELAVDDDNLYVLSSVVNDAEVLFNPLEGQLGDSRLALHVLPLTEEGTIDAGQLPRSTLLTIEDGDFNSSLTPELRPLGDGVMAIRLNRNKYTTFSIEYGGSTVMLWDLASNPLPDEPMVTYREIFTVDNSRRAQAGLLGTATGVERMVIHPTTEGLERVDLTLEGGPLR
ncbi:MAG: hypothetical protein AAFS10_01145 [Myxococcota bacterium]